MLAARSPRTGTSSHRLRADFPITATVFPSPSPEEPSGLYELAQVRGRLAQRLRALGEGLYELPEDLGDVAPVLFHAYVTEGVAAIENSSRSLTSSSDAQYASSS